MKKKDPKSQKLEYAKISCNSLLPLPSHQHPKVWPFAAGIPRPERGWKIEPAEEMVTVLHLYLLVMVSMVLKYIFSFLRAAFYSGSLCLG